MTVHYFRERFLFFCLLPGVRYRNCLSMPDALICHPRGGTIKKVTDGTIQSRY